MSQEFKINDFVIEIYKGDDYYGKVGRIIDSCIPFYYKIEYCKNSRKTLDDPYVFDLISISEADIRLHKLD